MAWHQYIEISLTKFCSFHFFHIYTMPVYVYLLTKSLIVEKQRIHLPMQETQELWIRYLGWENPLEEEVATHFSILAWQVPWTGEPGRLQSKGLQRVAHDWTTKPEQKDKHVFAFICMKWPLVTQIINRLKYPAFYIVFPLRYSMDIWNLTFLKKNSQFYAQTLLHSISAKIFTIYFIAQAWYLEVLLDSPISGGF